MRKLKKEVWPYEIHVKTATKEMDEWCGLHLGRRFQDWYRYYSDSLEKTIFAFKEEETLLVFKLKWNNK